MNDSYILELFAQGKRDKAFKKLYGLYPKIEKLILSQGGNKEDASDVFQEALIILYRNLEKSDFNSLHHFTPIYIQCLVLYGKTCKANFLNKNFTI